MEEAEKHHIHSNLIELIKNTNCDGDMLSKLYSSQVLTQQEMEQLESYSKPFDRAKHFYKILQTKSDGYRELLLILIELNQIRAYNIMITKEPKLKSYESITVNKNHLIRYGSYNSKTYKGFFIDKVVAVKVLDNCSEQDLKEITHIKSKAGKHRNIVPYLAAEFCNNKLCIALEMGFINLDDEIKMQFLQLNSNNVLEHCTEGLAYLHSHEIIHGNLKPSNIILFSDGKVKLSDYGCLKEIKWEGGRTYCIGETLEWLAPEILYLLNQANGENIAELTTNSDIFSLGCIFYFVLTQGQHPFGNPMERLYNILHYKSSKLPDAFDQKWHNLVSQMTTFPPVDRPNADAVLALLNNKKEDFCEKQDFSRKTERSSRSPVRKTIKELIPKLNITGISKLTEKLENLPSSPESASSSVPSPVPKFLRRASFRWISSVINRRFDGGSLTGSKFYTKFQKDELIEELSHRLWLSAKHLESLKKDINSTDESGNSLLQIAILNGESLAAIQDLIENGANPFQLNKDGKSVLHVAAEGGNSEVINYLISLGSDVNFPDNQGDTPLHRVVHAKQNFTEILKILLELGGKINAVNSTGNNLVELAVVNGRSAGDLDEIVKAGGNWKIKDENGVSVLHLAVTSGNLEAVKYFLELGVDPNILDANNNAILHSIVHAKQRYFEILDLLVEYGANLNVVDNQGNNILHVAADLRNTTNVLDRLVELGVNIRATNKMGQTVLHSAVKGGNPSAVEYFIAKGLDVNHKDKMGHTPLHLIAHAKQYFEETLRALLRHKVDVKAKTEEGQDITDILEKMEQHVKLDVLNKVLAELKIN